MIITPKELQELIAELEDQLAAAVKIKAEIEEALEMVRNFLKTQRGIDSVH